METQTKSSAAKLKENCEQYLAAFFQDLANCDSDLNEIAANGLPQAFGMGRERILQEIARKKNLQAQ
jgi:hypothetical protein